MVLDNMIQMHFYIDYGEPIIVVHCRLDVVPAAACNAELGISKGDAQSQLIASFIKQGCFAVRTTQETHY